MYAIYIGNKYKGVTPGKLYEIIKESKIKGKLNYYFINDNMNVDYRRASLFKETMLSKNISILENLEEDDI